MMTVQSAIRLFLVEDHELVLRGLRELLSTRESFDIVGSASSVAEATKAIPRLMPDICLIDLRLPDGLGTEIVRSLQALENPPKTIILTSFAEDSLVLGAMSANVNGYLLKDVEGTELIESILKVYDGQAVYSVGVSNIMAALVRGDNTSQNHRSRIESLTAQEFRVLSEVSKGKSNKDVATSLNLSEKTVKNYLSNILSKLGYSSRTEAAVNFVRNFG